MKNSILRSNLCDYNDAYTIVIGSITVRNIAAQVQANNTTILIAEAEKQYATRWCSWHWCSNANV